jgi:Na+/H+ antiporter NhaC
VTAEPGALSLLPVAVALVVAIGSRNVLLGLLMGLLSGIGLLHGPDPLALVAVMVRDHLVPQLTDGYNAGVLVLLAFIGGFVALMERSGGGAAFAARVTHLLTTRLRLQLAAWLGGILIFFSDLGTPLIVGPVFRPLADRLRMSRVKLAYIVDSTASPVAILVPFIGWGVYIMSLLDQQFQALGVDQSDYQALVAALPFQFYAWLAVLMVPVLALAGVDAGPMARAERLARLGREEHGIAAPVEDATVPGARASFVWVPLLVLGLTLSWMLVPLGFPFERVSGADFRAGLSTAYLAAAFALMALMAVTGSRRWLASVQVYLEGMSRMMQVAVMLVLAWALSDLGEVLGTPRFVAALAADGVDAWLLPALVFVASGLISFATGSSWGTFAIMMPLALPAAVMTGAPLPLCIGAVLSGGLFGDHASPLSETTILSATGAGADQYGHFQTQLPYALGNGALAVSGFLVAGAYPEPWLVFLLLVIQVAVIVVLRMRLQRLQRRGQVPETPPQPA